MKKAKLKQGLKVRVVDIFTRVFIVDVRGEQKVFELIGNIRVPALLLREPQKVCWRIPGFKVFPKGVTTDINGLTLNFVFPFVSRQDGVGSDDKDLSSGDIKDLFLKYEPSLKLAKAE